MIRASRIPALRRLVAAVSLAVVGTGLAVAVSATPAQAKYGAMYHPTSGRVVEKIHRGCDGTTNSHPGIDIANTFGTPVYAAYRGTVIDVHRNLQNGLVVVIRHESGYTSEYARMSAEGVSEGQPVSRGQRIGSVGDRGHDDFRPFLHFEVRRYGDVYLALNQGYECGQFVYARQPIRADFPGLS